VTVSELMREREANAGREADRIALHAGSTEADALTPAQEFALLVLRQSDMSKLIVTKLWHSTVRPTPRDYESLVALHLVERIQAVRHKLLPRGRYRANRIAERMAKELDIKPLALQFRAMGHRDGRHGRITKTTFNPY
jgi:hypothetical protein